MFYSAGYCRRLSFYMDILLHFANINKLGSLYWSSVSLIPNANVREAELEVDNDVFIGPAPPAVVAEAASANEAERFEEVS